MIPNVRAHGAVMFGDGDVIARNEAVPVKLEPRFIVIGTLGIVIEGPAATRATHQVSQFVLSTRAEALYATPLARRAPFVGEKMPILIERSCKLVTAVPAACRKRLVAGKLQSNTFHGHGVRSSRPALVAGNGGAPARAGVVAFERLAGNRVRPPAQHLHAEVRRWLAMVEGCLDRDRRAASRWRTAILPHDKGFCFGSAWHPRHWRAASF